MSPSASTDDVATQLAEYLARLRARHDALVQLSRTSSEMVSVLRDDPLADVSTLLGQREDQCKQLGALRPVGLAAENRLIGAARQLQAGGGETGAICSAVLAMQTACAELIEHIQACQIECETMMRLGIEATSRAIRESVQRRKLDAVYGPACRHDTPVFMDKQQ